MVKTDRPHSPVYGLMKSALDAHTLGLSHIAQLLQECGCRVVVGNSEISEAVDKISERCFFEKIKSWLIIQGISHLGFSYRLDPGQAVEIFGRLIAYVDADTQLSPLKHGLIRSIYFAGLPESCRLVEKHFGERVKTFRGDESVLESLKGLGIPDGLIPSAIVEDSVYDDIRLSFGKRLIEEERQFHINPHPRLDYKHYGTSKDHLMKRLDSSRQAGQLPLMRVHAGPYLKDREEALVLFSEWLRKLSGAGYLDIVSIGSSQLSQERFGEEWNDLPNGGGVPINNPFELRTIQEDASPMLVRTYSATNNIPHVARILEENLNMAWHALSLWWFNKLDGRGPLSLQEGLRQHLETMQFIAATGKPYEPNTPHHFAFRGGDDVAYIVSGYLAAKTAKHFGISSLILQNMMNTPRPTWGVRDLAKSRAFLKLVRGLEDKAFQVIHQPRAGLDYFSPDENKAKSQLAAVTALMADVEPDKEDTPEIIHVVSYSEALFLATPEVINESIQITRAVLEEYPAYRKKNDIHDIILNKDLKTETEDLYQDASQMIKDIERTTPDLYSSEGLFSIFRRGYLPVPYLWEERERFLQAIDWETKIIHGGVYVVDAAGKKIPMQKRLEKIKRNTDFYL